MKIKIVNDNTTAVADHLLEDWYESVKGDVAVEIANELQFLRLRVAHSKGEIHVEEILSQDGTLLEITANGRIKSWPDGVFEVSLSLFRELL